MLQLRRSAPGLLAALLAVGCAEVAKVGEPGSTLEQVPASSFMVLSFQQPGETLARLRKALSDTGALSHPQMEAALESIRSAFGVNILEPESLRQRGIDLSREILFARDEALLYQGSDGPPLPASYVVLAVSDFGALSAWLREIISQRSPEATFQEALINGATVLYASDREKLLFAVAQRGDFAYLFAPDLGGHTVGGAALEAFLRDLAAFFERAQTPLITDPAFRNVARRLEERPDIFYYKDEERAREVLSRILARVEGAPESLPVTSPVQVEASGVWFGTEAIEFQGVKHIKPEFQELLARAVSTGAEILPPELFPPDTALFGRLSVNPEAARELLSAMLSDDLKRDSAGMWQGLKEEIRAETGLDLEEDILAAFSGEIALGMPTPSIDSLVATHGDLRVLSPVIFAARLKSPLAGDKLLAAIEARAQARVREGGAPLRTEEYNGQILYSVEDPDNPLAWGRVEDIFVVGFEANAVLDALQRGANPEGPSFVEQLPLFAREIPIAHATSGFTMDLGAFLTGISQLLPPREGSILSEIGARVGFLSFKGSYEGGFIRTEGELLLMQ